MMKTKQQAIKASDCISRQAAIDALAKFVPYAICDESTESYANGLTDAYNLICQLPSAQPEIIMCKECRFAHLTHDGDCKYCDKWTDEFGIPEELYLDGDFFCGYAERRIDE